MNTRKYPKITGQQALILKSLAKGGTVTKLTAVHQKIGNINDVIMRLRRRGWDIQTVTSTDINGEPYTKYELNPRHRPLVHTYLSASIAS